MKRLISLVLLVMIVFNMFVGLSITVNATEDNNATQESNVSNIFYNRVNQADFFNEHIYTADSLVSNSTMNEITYYMNSETSSQYMVNYLQNRPLFMASYATWEAGNFIAGPVETTISLINKTPYYENILLKLIDATYEEKSFADLFKRTSIQKALKFRKKFVNTADTILSTNYLLDKKEFVDVGIEDKEVVQKFAKSFVKDEPYHIGEDTINLLDEVISGLDTFENLYKTVGTYAAICEVKQSTIDFLKEMKAKTDDKYLIDAINDITVMHDNSFFGLMRNGIKTILKTTIKEGLSYLVKEWKKQRLSLLYDGTLAGYLKVDPVLIATQLTLNIGNMAFSIDNKLDKYESMKALCKIEDAAEKVLTSQVSEYKSLRSTSDIYDNTEHLEESGEIVVSGVKFVFNCYITDSDLYKDIINICRKDWISFINDEQFEEKLAQEELQQQVYIGTLDKLMPHAGSCGNNIFWYLGVTKTLFLVGYGDMYNYTVDTVPWKDYKSRIDKIYISSFTTSIGAYSFC